MSGHTYTHTHTHIHTHTHTYTHDNYYNPLAPRLIIVMKSTKVQTLGGNIGTFGLETPLHAYVLGMPSIEPRSSTICIVLSMHVYM